MDSSSLSRGSNCLHGKVAMVTGGARGIGRAVAECFQHAGALGCIIDCDADAGESTAMELTERYPDRPINFLRANLEKLEDIIAVSNHFSEKYEHLDVLCQQCRH